MNCKHFVVCTKIIYMDFWSLKARFYKQQLMQNEKYILDLLTLDGLKLTVFIISFSIQNLQFYDDADSFSRLIGTTFFGSL